MFHVKQGYRSYDKRLMFHVKHIGYINLLGSLFAEDAVCIGPFFDRLFDLVQVGVQGL
jgi:hypothetical protein